MWLDFVGRTACYTCISSELGLGIFSCKLCLKEQEIFSIKGEMVVVATNDVLLEGD